MLTEETVMGALESVIDPEIGMSVVDLGMVREIVIKGDIVEISMVLTAPGCPLAGLITEQVRQAAAAVPGVKDARVIVLDRPWNPAWMKKPMD